MDIPKLILDPQNEDELVQLAYDRIREASGGQLNDFRPGSPIAALVEGQVFAVAELLYYLNLLPEALALESFRLLGVTRSPGTAATGRLRFLLTTPLNTNFIINAGYLVPYKDSYYVLQEQLVIPPGATEADVLVQSARPGSDMNCPEFGLMITNPGINYLQAIYNPEAISGGTDLEDIADTISRAQQVLRSRDVLVSVTDYELAAQELLGAGSRAKCVPYLSSDKTQKAPGQVHVFLCGADKQPVSTGTAVYVQSELQKRVFAASQVWVSSYEQDPVSIEATCGVTEISEVLADEIAEAIYEYLDPTSYDWGTKVRTNEVAYYVRQVPDVLEVDSIRINGQPLDYLLANQWTAPYAEEVIINLMQINGTTQTYYRGLGADVD